MAKGSSETVLGKNVRIRGRISGEGDLMVQGTLEGDVVLRGDFTLDEGAEAQSSVTANDVTVSGSLEGGIQAEGEVTVTASGTFRGDVRAAQVTIEDGATFAGHLEADFELPAELSGAPAKRR
jgi:cytoskeletal protein CcmA (bactofilin family)